MARPDLIGSSFFGLDLSNLTNRLGTLRRRVSQRQLLLEFDLGLLRYATARIREGQLELLNVGRLALPKEAQERGVPSDPDKMASLLRELCKENQLSVNQVSVAIPPEAAYQHVVDLPAELTLEQAREQILDPELGLQLPIPLGQTDFDLVPCGLPLLRDADRLYRRYLLIAIPSDFTTRLVTTMQLTDLNLQRLELSSMAAFRLKTAELQRLNRGEYALWLELQPGCTHGVLLASSGPVAFRKLVAIRDFPEPELTSDQSAIALSESLCAEEITVHDPRYLALSELDLRVLMTEIREWIPEISSDIPDLKWSCIWISGVNSAHPLLAEMLSEALQLPVLHVDPLESSDLAEFSCSTLLLKSGLARLVGLAAGLLPATNPDFQPLPDLDWVISAPLSKLVTLEATLEPITSEEDDVSEGIPSKENTFSAEIAIESESASLLIEDLHQDHSTRSELEAIEPMPESMDPDSADEGEVPSLSLSSSDQTMWPSIDQDLGSNQTQSTPQPGDEHEDLLPSTWPSIGQTSKPEVIAEEVAGASRDATDQSAIDSKDDVDKPLGDLRFNDE